MADEQDPYASWQHLDPRLLALYQKHKITPQGAGTGFTDANYFDQKIKTDPGYDYLTRLDKDLSGTGTDRSTGTVWGAAGPPQGLDQNASDAMPDMTGSKFAALGMGDTRGQTPGTIPPLDITSQGGGPGSYEWRQQQLQALQQSLINGTLGKF